MSNVEAPIDLTEAEAFDLTTTTDTRSDGSEQSLIAGQSHDESVSRGQPMAEILIPRTRKRKIEKKWQNKGFAKTENIETKDREGERPQTINVVERETKDQAEDAESDTPTKFFAVSNIESDYSARAAHQESKLMPNIVQMLDHGYALLEGHDYGLGPSTFFCNPKSRSFRDASTHRVLIKSEETSGTMQQEVSGASLQQGVSLSFMAEETLNDQGTFPDEHDYANIGNLAPSPDESTMINNAFEQNEASMEDQEGQHADGPQYRKELLKKGPDLPSDEGHNPNLLVSNEDLTALLASRGNDEDHDIPDESGVVQKSWSTEGQTNHKQRNDEKAPQSYGGDRYTSVMELIQAPRASTAVWTTVSPTSTISGTDREYAGICTEPPMLPSLNSSRSHGSSSDLKQGMEENEITDEPLLAPMPHSETDLVQSPRETEGFYRYPRIKKLKSWEYEQVTAILQNERHLRSFEGPDDFTEIQDQEHPTESSERYDDKTAVVQDNASIPEHEEDRSFNSIHIPNESVVDDGGDSLVALSSRAGDITQDGSRDLPQQLNTHENKSSNHQKKRSLSADHVSVQLPVEPQESPNQHEHEVCDGGEFIAERTRNSRRVSRDSSPERGTVIYVQCNYEGLTGGGGVSDSAFAATHSADSRQTRFPMDHGFLQRRHGRRSVGRVTNFDRKQEVIDLTDATESEFGITPGGRSRVQQTADSVSFKAADMERSFAALRLVEERRAAAVQAANDPTNPTPMLRQERTKRDQTV